MMTNLLTELSSPRPSSGYGSSEDELNFPFHRRPTSGLLTPTSDLSTSSSGLWISTSVLSGRTSSLSTPTSDLLTPATSDDGSCPVTPDHVTSVVEFPPVFDLFDRSWIWSDGGFFTGAMDLGDGCSEDLRGPLLNDLSCLGLELDFEKSTDYLEPARSEDESGGNLLAALLKRPRSLYPVYGREMRTDGPSLCASADPLIASHQVANCSAPGDDLRLDHLSKLTRSNSDVDELVLPGNRCYRKVSSPATVNRTSADRQGNGNQGKVGVHRAARLGEEGSSGIVSESLKNTTYISRQSFEVSAHQTTTARTRPHLVTGSGQSSVASGSRTTTGSRRSFSELDDHRYSSCPLSYGPPPPKVPRAARTVASRSTCPRATILETFLLTKEPLRANAGSDAMLAVNGLAQLHRKSSSSTRFHEGKSVLEGLLTETNNYARGWEPPTVSEPVALDPVRTVVTSSNPRSLEVSEASNRVEGVTRNRVEEEVTRISRKTSSLEKNCDLLSDHLFSDCDSVQLTTTSANDDEGVGQNWIPCRFDDRVFSSEVDDLLRQHFQSEDLMRHPFLSDLLCEPKTY